MIDKARQLQLADDLLRRFAAALRGAQLYSATHPLVLRNIEAFSDIVEAIHAHQPSCTLAFLGDQILFGEIPLPKAGESLGEVARRLRGAGVERITIERGATRDELAAFLRAAGQAVARGIQPPSDTADADAFAFPHVRVGRVQVEQRVEATVADMATIGRLYSEAVQAAGAVWASAQEEGQPDPRASQGVVDGLAQAVAQNRTALLALTALKKHDNYTFTHMVNVSILTMAQARGLGIDGSLLREFGVAALMHDIGKVRTPAEILTKPDKLTDDEFGIMKRHTIDGAEMLRQTPEIPALAPVVALEHHLRLDGTGYPDGVARSALNLGTMLCSIADVYDAMRSQRQYQNSFPTDRILAVLKRNDGQQFDQQLVRRFVQLVGIYPAGTLVRLSTGEIAVVTRIYAPDPHRPKVRVIIGPDGHRLDVPYDIRLWDVEPDREAPPSIVTPVDSTEYHLDPLAFM